MTYKTSIKQLILSHSNDANFVRQGYGLILRAVKHWACLEEIILILEEKEKKVVRDHYLFAILILEMMNPSNKNKKIGGQVTKMIKSNVDIIKQILIKGKVFENEE
jgi:hypothetical protein